MVFHKIGACGGDRLDRIDLVSPALALASASRNYHLVLRTVTLPAFVVEHWRRQLHALPDKLHLLVIQLLVLHLESQVVSVRVATNLLDDLFLIVSLLRSVDYLSVARRIHIIIWPDLLIIHIPAVVLDRLVDLDEIGSGEHVHRDQLLVGIALLRKAHASGGDRLI